MAHIERVNGPRGRREKLHLVRFRQRRGTVTPRLVQSAHGITAGQKSSAGNSASASFWLPLLGRKGPRIFFFFFFDKAEYTMNCDLIWTRCHNHGAQPAQGRSQRSFSATNAICITWLETTENANTDKHKNTTHNFGNDSGVHMQRFPGLTLGLTACSLQQVHCAEDIVIAPPSPRDDSGHPSNRNVCLPATYCTSD